MNLQIKATVLSLVLALVTVVTAAPPPLERTAETAGPPAKDNSSTLLTPAQEATNENVPRWQVGCTDNSTRPDCVALKAVLHELGSYRPGDPTAAINDGMVAPLTPDEVDQFCEKLPETTKRLPSDLKAKVQKYGPMKKMLSCTAECVQTISEAEQRVDDRCRALLIGAELIVQAERPKPEQKVETVDGTGSKLKAEPVAIKPAVGVVQQPVSEVKEKVLGASKTNGTTPVGEAPLPVPEHAAASHQTNGGEVGGGAAVAPPPAAAAAPAPGEQTDKQPKDVENPEPDMPPNDDDDDNQSDEQEDPWPGNKPALDNSPHSNEEDDDNPLKASKEGDPPVEPEEEDGEREKVASNIIQGPVDPFYNQNDSNFFSYFLFAMFSCALCYVAYHNKSKLLGLVVEGRPRTSSGRGGFSKGRKHTAAYRKLDSNLEEAITSGSKDAGNHSSSQIIY
ncbi:trans-Golgi network integral membrane protein 2-like [Anopheles albimanus]|uniref:Uncharacterized protein n=1 Tax=Anopheles albimanus TaxID=7167 RepID=A0A182FT31_ANOAL|nr:trans-Golgi network integral membrane protein 2-like [Anopheles albimanus]XP_035780707.1 trans-Golgi network integral membrane protein 2-like [Anopheles albimanus]